MSRGISFDEALLELKKRYRGYRFSKEGAEICNPYTLLRTLSQNNPDSYPETPDRIQSFLSELLQNDATLKLDPEIYLSRSTCLSPVEEAVNWAAAPYLYPSRALSIRGYSYGIYKLGIPNYEAVQVIERLGASQ